MRPRAKAAPILLVALALIAACERSLPEPPAQSAPEVRTAAAVTASQSSCKLPLGHFAPSLRQLVGSILSPPKNLVLIDRAGRILWNSVPVEPQRLREYLSITAAAEPRIFLRVYPDLDAPCAVVRETLDAAIEVGRCSPERCAFEWPPGNPPPPPLPDGAALLGKWVLVSIDNAPPPPQAPPIELTFTDGEVGARSQCVSFAWLIGIEEARLRLQVPNRMVSMCARGLSDWEKRFETAMAAAARIESDGGEMIVTGPSGTLKLKRPG